MSVGAGQLNCRIAIQQRIDTLDDYGQRSTGWTTIGAAWANIRGRSTSQTDDGASHTGTATYRVVIRYASAIAALPAHSLRINHAGSHYDVTGAVDPDGTRQVLIIDCVEVTP